MKTLPSRSLLSAGSIRLRFSSSLRVAAGSLLGAVALGCGSFSATAAVPSYEGYNYSAGTLIVGSSGGTGWENSWQSFNGNSASVAVASEGLSYSGLATSGLAVNTGSNNFGGATRTFSSTGVTQDLYISFLARPSATNTGALVRLDSGGQVSFGLIGGKFQIATGYQTPTATGDTGISYAGGTTYLVVAKMEFASQTLRLAVNPQLGVEPTTWNASSTFSGSTASSDFANGFNSLFFGGNGGSAGTLLDELRVSTTYAGVTPTAVPEPSTVVSMAAGLGLLGLTRRRRSNG